MGDVQGAASFPAREGAAVTLLLWLGSPSHGAAEAPCSQWGLRRWAGWRLSPSRGLELWRSGESRQTPRPGTEGGGVKGGGGGVAYPPAEDHCSPGLLRSHWPHTCFSASLTINMIAAQLLAYYFTELKDDQLKKVSQTPLAPPWPQPCIPASARHRLHPPPAFPSI